MSKEPISCSDDSKFVSPAKLGDDRQTVRKILEQNYGLALTSCQRMDGYDDVNYLVAAIRMESVSDLETRQPSRYILRIINAYDARNPRRIEAIGAVMKHVNSKSIPTQENVQDLRGEEMSFHTIESHGRSTSYGVVLRTFLPGTVMSTMAITPTDVFTCGVFIARVTQALEDFHHEFFDSFPYTWGVNNLSDVKSYVGTVKDEGHKCLVERVLDACQLKIASVAHKLRTGQIHGDIGLSNVILPDENGVLHDTSQSLTPRIPADVWSLIDFHDTHQTFTICELASSSALIMTNDQPVLVERVDIPGHLLAGYRSLISLDITERHIFPYLVMTNICTLLLTSCYYSKLNPSNAEYMEGNSEHGWSLLERMWKMTPPVLQAAWERVAQESERQNAKLY